MKKSKNRKNKKINLKPSRNIPKNISLKVKQRHFFECAWCGINLVERHHIKEWHLGGDHSEDNLILLCPNCHTLVHKGDIKADQLIKRKSTHLQGDRIQGGFRTSLRELKFEVGSNIVEGSKHIIAYEYQPILSIEIENEIILFSATFYDKEGNLIFWMKRNLFWAPSYFEVTSSFDSLLIFDKIREINVLKLYKQIDDPYVHIECNTFMNNAIFQVKPNQDVSVNTTHVNGTIRNCKVTNYYIAFWIHGEQHTPEEFLRINNEFTEKRGYGMNLGF